MTIKVGGSSVINTLLISGATLLYLEFDKENGIILNENDVCSNSQNLNICRVYKNYDTYVLVAELTGSHT